MSIKSPFTSAVCMFNKQGHVMTPTPAAKGSIHKPTGISLQPKRSQDTKVFRVFLQVVILLVDGEV
jgi:hypothetical protein